MLFETWDIIPDTCLTGIPKLLAANPPWTAIPKYSLPIHPGQPFQNIRAIPNNRSPTLDMHSEIFAGCPGWVGPEAKNMEMRIKRTG
jgi:hypothetical protein